MSKKLAKTEKGVVRVIQEQNKRFKDTCRQFYSDGIVEEFAFSAVDGVGFDLLCEGRNPFAYKNDKNIENKIWQIHQNVLQGKTGNIEVRFDEGMIYSGGEKYELCNTIFSPLVKYQYQNVFFKTGDRYDAKVFMEDGTENAYLVLNGKDGSEDARILSLNEFYLLSMWCEEGTIKDTGIMIRYNREENDAKFDIVNEVTFNEVKELLVADWLQEAWKEAKEANEKWKESMAQQQKISKQKDYIND